MADDENQNLTSERNKPSLHPVSLDLVKGIMQNAIEQHLAMEEKMKDLTLAVSEPSTHLAEITKELSRVMDPFSNELGNIVKIANQMAPALTVINEFENNSSLAAFKDVARWQQDMEQQAKIILEGISLPTLGLPAIELAHETVIPHQKMEVVIPSAIANNRDHEEDLIKVSKLAAHEVMKEIQFRATDKYRKDEDIIGMNLPEKFDWPQITIHFIQDQLVSITIDDKTDDIAFRTFKEMGFEDRRSASPDKQWRMLTALAESHGIISWTSSESNNNIKKRKELLAKALIKYFELESDPFEPYRQEKGYKIKINLVPQIGVPTRSNLYEDTILEGIQDVFGE